MGSLCSLIRYLFSNCVPNRLAYVGKVPFATNFSSSFLWDRGIRTQSLGIPLSEVIPGVSSDIINYRVPYRINLSLTDVIRFAADRVYEAGIVSRQAIER
jgi:hypothetical protein